jgi:DNA polymerase-4
MVDPGLGICHVDMDAFYAAAELLADPSLAGRPVIVGGSGARGVVASCSYEARAYGIHSAMPSIHARRLCPHAVFLPGRFDYYSQLSRDLHAILTSYTPLVEGVALDEAYLDVHGGRRLFGPPSTIARTIREQVHEELGLWCSVGVARSKLLAKLASEAAKPVASHQGTRPGHGVVVVQVADELAFLHPLPCRVLPGVGPATARRLARSGISSVRDLAEVPLASLVQMLGRAAGRSLHELAWARDERRVVADREPKSVGHEETYANDIREVAELRRQVVRMADAVATRLRAGHRCGRTVTLKLRYGDFSTITRSQTLGAPVDEGPEIAKVAHELLARTDVSPGIRLLGVSVSGLTDRAGEPQVLDLKEPGRPRWSRASDAVEAVRVRFGATAVGPSTLAEAGSLALKRPGDTQWGPSTPSSEAPARPPSRVVDDPPLREDCEERSRSGDAASPGSDRL